MIRNINYDDLGHSELISIFLHLILNYFLKSKIRGYELIVLSFILNFNCRKSKWKDLIFQDFELFNAFLIYLLKMLCINYNQKLLKVFKNNT